MIITHTSCPICASHNTKTFLKVKDFSVTKEDFELQKCADCNFVFTQNAPDEEHITPFYHFEDYISHTDTKQGLMHKLYHFVRKFTLRKKMNWIRNATGKKTGNLLDIGSGTGAFLHFAKNNQWNVLGIEADATARAKAKELYNVDTETVEKLYSLKQNTYDVITMWHVLEHVHQLDAYMYQIKKLLNGAGKLFIAVPNYTSYDAAFYKNFWAAYDVPRHLYHFSPEAMLRLADKYNFTITAYKPMWFDSFYVSMLSEKYKQGNVLRAVVIGLLSNVNALFNTKKCSSITYVLTSK